MSGKPARPPNRAIERLHLFQPIVLQAARQTLSAASLRGTLYGPKRIAFTFKTGKPLRN
jgi:hypothetical protein